MIDLVTPFAADKYVNLTNKTLESNRKRVNNPEPYVNNFIESRLRLFSITHTLVFETIADVTRLPFLL